MYPMNKIRFLLLFLFATMVVSAQNTDDKKYLLTSKTNTIGISTLSFVDPYLSPLTYDGLAISYDNEARRFLSTENTNISTQSLLNLQAGILLNTPVSSDMLYLGANYGWEMCYHAVIPIKGLKVLVGGLLDIDFGFKNMERNVNNPVNLDISTNLNLSALARYTIPLRHKTLQLQLALQTPVIGYMFVPKAGASYYEMFDLGNLTDAFHFSSLYNKRGLNSTLTVEVPFNRSVWRFGLKMKILRYSANDLVFDKNEFSLLVGTSFDTFNFAGRKNKAPKNFVSTQD